MCCVEIMHMIIQDINWYLLCSTLQAHFCSDIAIVMSLVSVLVSSSMASTFSFYVLFCSMTGTVCNTRYCSWCIDSMCIVVSLIFFIVEGPFLSLVPVSCSSLSLCYSLFFFFFSCNIYCLFLRIQLFFHLIVVILFTVPNSILAIICSTSFFPNCRRFQIRCDHHSCFCLSVWNWCLIHQISICNTLLTSI